MKKIATVLAAVIALASSALVPSAAQAFPITTDEVCATNVISPVRGSGPEPVEQGVRHVTPALPSFDTSLGQLTSVDMTASVKAEVQGSVTNLTSTVQPFRTIVGGSSFAGRTGANGYINLGRVVVTPELSVPGNQTSPILPLVAQNTQSTTYDPALWATLGDFDAYLSLDGQWTNTSVFSWTFSVDRVTFTTCVQYSYQPRVEREAGADRFDTAADIALAAHPGGTDVVYVANGMNYPDALSAGPLAAAEGAPLLLVTPTTIPAATSQAISSLAPDRVVVIGGIPSVSAAVFAQLDSMTGPVQRIAGADRFETSRLIAIKFAAIAAGVDRVFIATGLNYPDALSAGSAAFALGAPVILVNGGESSLDSATTKLIGDLDPSFITIVGGTPSVSAGVAEDLGGLGSGVNRLAGANRYETSHLVNSFAFPSSANNTAYFATGNGFPDALAGSAWAASEKAPLFVVQTDCVPPSALSDLQRMGISDVVLLGGTPSLSNAVFSLTACT